MLGDGRALGLVHDIAFAAQLAEQQHQRREERERKQQRRAHVVWQQPHCPRHARCQSISAAIRRTPAHQQSPPARSRTGSSAAKIQRELQEWLTDIGEQVRVQGEDVHEREDQAGPAKEQTLREHLAVVRAVRAAD